MAHEVSFSIPERSLGKSDVVFAVYKNGQKLGTLKVSKGSIVWFPRDTTNGHKMGWEKFNRIMQENATKIETR